MIAYAAAADEAQKFIDKLNEIIIYPLITVMMTVAFLVFLWGCFQFILNAENSTARTDGKKHIIWGIIGMLVMVSAYSILYIAANSFGATEYLTPI